MCRSTSFYVDLCFFGGDFARFPSRIQGLEAKQTLSRHEPNDDPFAGGLSTSSLMKYRHKPNALESQGAKKVLSSKCLAIEPKARHPFFVCARVLVSGGSHDR
jgi:hypothetical protein